MKRSKQSSKAPCTAEAAISIPSLTRHRRASKRLGGLEEVQA